MDDSVNAPKDLQEFVYRLDELVYYLHDCFFGYTHEIAITKTLKRDTSPQALVEAMIGFEKYCQDKKDESYLKDGLDLYSFLKLALEKDAPFDSEYHLGVKRDRSGLSLSQKNVIAVQATAQILWYLEKNKIPTIEKMKDTLLNKEAPFNAFLKLIRFNDPRTIENWIREIFPVSKELRKSKQNVPEDHFNQLIEIPGVFLDFNKTINFPKLHFVITCITKVLMTLGWTLDMIDDSPFIHFYQYPLKFYPHMYVRNWIREAANRNGCIFDP